MSMKVWRLMMIRLTGIPVALSSRPVIIPGGHRDARDPALARVTFDLALCRPRD